MMTELEKLKAKKEDVSRKLQKLNVPEETKKYIYFEVAKQLLISDETVKNYRKGNIADGYMGEAIYKLLVAQLKRKVVPAGNPS